MTTTTSNSNLGGIKALFFDVFGTAVDWRSTVTRTLFEKAQRSVKPTSTSNNDDNSKNTNNANANASARSKAASMTSEDWGRFAADWRATYYKFTHAIAADPSKAYKTIDQHQLDSLHDLLLEHGLEGLWNADEVKEMSLIWHKLDPWPDTVAGIKALNELGYATCTLSNGNVELLEDMAEYAKLEWKHVFSSAMFGTYKPNPKVYLGAAEKLGLEPSECGMVAAHLGDLRAAKDTGFGAVVYVERSQEEAWDEEKVKRSKDEGWVDVWVTEAEEGFVAVAQQVPGVQ